MFGADAKHSAKTPGFLIEMQAGCTPDSVEAVICLSGPQARGRSWLAGCYPALPSLLRRDRTACAARPTRLAPGCTLAQPVTSLPPLVGSYPTVSALTGLFLRTACAGSAFCCGCSRCLPFGTQCPHLLFREATFPCSRTGRSREVPLAARSANDQRRRSSLPYPVVKVLRC